MEKSFGEHIRTLRVNNEMPLRKLAALLDIDQSTLSKIERNERKLNGNLVQEIANIFNLDYKELKIFFLSDHIVNYLSQEDYSMEALKLAEEKITLKKKK